MSTSRSSATARGLGTYAGRASFRACLYKIATNSTLDLIKSAENIPLGVHLADTFAVVNYRRRGRGDSSDTAPYAVQREVENLAAVIDAKGGRAHLFGASSGGALALEAAAAGLPVDRIAVHEVPYKVGEPMIAAWRDYTADLEAALDADNRDEALRLFMRLAGSSDDDIAGAETSTFWPALRALAPTLRYDAAWSPHTEGSPPPATDHQRLENGATSSRIRPKSVGGGLEQTSLTTHLASSCGNQRP